MYDFDTRAQCVGGPVDGRLEMVPGKPGILHFEQFEGKWESKKLIRHTYLRDEKKLLEGDTIAYVYAGSQEKPLD